MLKKIIDRILPWLPRNQNQLFDAGNSLVTLAIRTDALIRMVRESASQSPPPVSSLILLAIYIAITMIGVVKTLKRIRDENM